MTPKYYSALMKFIHWVMAFQIIALLSIGFYMSDMPWGESKKTLMMLHKSCGVTTLIFIIARIITRIFTPTLESRGSKVIRTLAACNAALLYLCMTAMAFSGFLMSDLSGHSITFFNIIELPIMFSKHPDIAKNLHLVHIYVAIPLAILTGIHFLGALYHRIILRDDVLSRMLPSMCSKKKYPR